MINIIADTTCGIPKVLRDKLGIPFVYQIILIMGQTFHDDHEIDTETFIKKLKVSAELPKTAAPPPEEYIPLYRKLAKPGDTAIVITPSKDMSGTYRSAWVAKQEFPEADIRVVDSRTIAGGLGSIVLQALYWVKEGWNADQIVDGISSMSGRERSFFLVDTLEYLQKGGRIGGAAALFGTVLQIKPILTILDGKVAAYEKVRTKSAALARLKELVNSGCPPKQEAWLSISHCSALNVANDLAAEFKSKLGFKYIHIYEVPPAIVVHGGPNIVNVSFFVDE
ncbi:MAG: DegV family protein [Anaerolineaceae bacterium]|nr:DegV family protein [Anaerolineaceae bacterium]